MPLVVLATCTALAGAAAGSAPLAAAAPTIRTVTKTFNVTVPPSDGATIGFFAASQRTSTQCGRNETALAPGIVSTTHYVAGHSFGPAAASAFLVGPSGRATARLQLLCVRGGTIVHKRIEAKTVPGLGGSVNGSPAGRATATASCSPGQTAVAAPLSQEFGPGLGRFTSTPFGPRGWRVVVDGVVDQLVAAGIVPAYADIACTKAASIVKTQKTVTLGDDATAATTITCAGGRKALGWGVELDAYSSRFPSGGTWNTPMVTKAMYNGPRTAVSFGFGMPRGSSASGVAGTDAVAHVVCGRLT